ncbi:glycoside hydrolase family 2 protein [Paenibacillus sp. GCM10027628]|uniref:glycoside hydrolase family 2 protein n=1 Tax=Paenibacillus sp. GCM10027628 TaxID=3273413 RepID=UPI0036356B85
MIRLFQTHRIRRETELEGMWDFTTVPDDERLLPPSTYEYTMPVPGCWDVHPDFQTYRGVGWYRRIVRISRSGPVRFEFHGISHTADIYLDGRPIGHHYNAYTPFSLVIADIAEGEHELAIRVDNSFSAASALHVPNDYYTYGGIIRPAVLEEITDVFVERVHFTPIFEKGAWSGTINVMVRNVSTIGRTIEIKATLADKDFTVGIAMIDADSSAELSVTLDFPEVTPWSHEAPQLYVLETQLFDQESAEPLDDWIERIGFRVISTEGGQIRLNGKEIRLKGVCRHEDHPLVGAVFPLQLMAADLDLIADMGANAVRTTHYPNDRRFLDLCDERGIYVWEENHARGLGLEQMRHPLFAEQCENCNREMVEQHYNHPSILIWGILNECSSETEEGRTHYERQLRQIRSMDASRPLSYASHHHFTDICLELADIVSFNVYPGWYTEDMPGNLSDRLKAWADQSGGADKPFILSEFGADGYYGFRSPARVKGSEERQADIVGQALEDFLERPYISGMFIWQFCDCRVTEGTGWLLARAMTKNSKGIVDEYRRPKLAYEMVRSFYRHAIEVDRML